MSSPAPTSLARWGDQFAGHVPLLVRRVEQVGIAKSDEMAGRADPAPTPLPCAAGSQNPAIGELGVAGTEEVAVARAKREQNCGCARKVHLHR
jgi:hypothetical protein